MPSSVKLWDDFFERYYEEAIHELAAEYPDKRSLVIDFRTFENFDMDAAQELLEHPDAVLKHAVAALQSYSLPSDVELKNVHVRVSRCPVKVRRRDIRQELIDTLISLDGAVQRTTDVSPRILVAAFRCIRCDHVSKIQQDRLYFVEPHTCEGETCGRRGPFKLILEESEKLDTQKIRVQELTEDLKSGEKSQTIDVDIQDDLAGIVLPGNKVTITGILRAQQTAKAAGKTSEMNLYLEAQHISINEGQEHIVLTPADKARVRELTSAPDVISRLVSSFAPTVHGLEYVKESILCSAVSSGYFVRPDGTPQREFSHILICSDPGMAKTNLKYALKKIFPGLLLSSGTGSTKAGLTAAAIKDDFANGAYSIEAGTLALADGSGVGLDEFDKFNKDEIRNLNDALSNCQFEIDKAGFHLKLWARCFVVAFQNPKNGRFDSYRPLSDQVDIPPDTLSRFDLIFTLQDVVEKTGDFLVGSKIARAWVGETDPSAGPICTEDMQKYLAYARTLSPKFSPGVVEEIIQQYVRARARSKDGRVAVTPRYQESLFRLSKCEAKLALSETVELEHLKRAVQLLETCIAQVGTDESGNVDADVLALGMGKSQRDKMRLIRTIVQDLMTFRGNGAASLLEIIQEAKSKGVPNDEAADILVKLKSSGELIEVSEGRFRVV